MNSKFLKILQRINSDNLKLFQNKTALPTLQIYENEDLVGNFVRITDTLGEDFDSRDLKRFFAE